LGFAGGDLQFRRLEFRHRLTDRFGNLRADAFQIFLVAGRASLAVGESVTIRRAVRVSRADQNILGRDPLDCRARLVSQPRGEPEKVDRKSTRLNSSHVAISYAVFCLKKKKTK